MADPSLVLNHAFLEGIAFLPPENARASLVDLMRTTMRARRVRGDSIVHVHPSLGTADVGGGKPFVRWANAELHSPRWADLLQQILQLISGPFVHALELDNAPAPTASEPSCHSAPTWLQETLLTLGHHALATGRPSWLLSYGDRPYLIEPVYLLRRASMTARVDNLRSDHCAEAAEAALVASAQVSTLDVLMSAEHLASQIVILDSARRSAERWTLDCSPERLLRSLTGLDYYAQAMQSGVGRESAAAAYQHVTSVEMSQEKGNTLKKPTLRAQRTFTLPDGTRELFDMHAKPGARTRIHIYAREEIVDVAGVPTPRIQVYVGHCGRHLDLK